MARADTIVELAPEPEAADGIVVQDLMDGSTVVDLDPEATARAEQTARSPSDDNLAADLSPEDNRRIAQRIIELVDADKTSRSEWLQKAKQGLEMCGLIGEGPNPICEGGATVIHPLIGEAAVQFQARAMEEVFPSAGPVKCTVIGEPTPELQDQAERVQAHMNWQCLEEDELYYEDKDVMILILSLVGSTFTKTYNDERLRITTSRFVAAEHVIVPYSARTLQTSPRVTHEMWMDRHEFEELQDLGWFLGQDELALQEPTEVGRDEVKDAADEATESTDDEEDGQYHLYETAIRWKLPKAGAERKNGRDDSQAWDEYIITVSVPDTKCVAIRRNTVTVRGREVRRVQFVHWKYLPGMGFYGWGLLHYLGSLGKSVTDTLRALLDSAAAANFQGGFATKELKALGQEIRVKFGTWKLVDVTADDLKNGFYTPPYREPSAAMVKLLEILVQAGQRFGSTTEAMVGEGTQNVPVGTTIARIEQASKVYSGIHKRLHRAAAKEFALRARLNAEHLDDQLEFSISGTNLVIYAQDYDDRVDVVPVSDPNIVSTPQRIQVAEAQLQLARTNPANFDIWEVERRYLQALKVPDIDKVHIKPDSVPMLDPVSEGVRVMSGQAIKVYPEQDHQAHLAVHMGQMQMLAGSPVEQIAAPLLQSHIAQHMASQYRIQMSMQLGVVLPDPTGLKPGEQSPVPPEAQDQIGMAAAQMMMAQQAQAGQQPPDPESALKLAQARKTAAEAQEVENRVSAGDQDARMVLEQAMQQIAQLQQALQEGVLRDQKAEEDRLNLMATLADLEERLAGMEQAGAQGEAQRKTEEKESSDIQRAKIDADAKVRVAEKAAIAERDKAELKRQIEEVGKQVKDLIAQVAEAKKAGEKQESRHADPAPAQPLPPITIGPIVIEKASGAKVIELKKTDDGKYVGTSKEPSE